MNKVIGMIVLAGVAAGFASIVTLCVHAFKVADIEGRLVALEETVDEQGPRVLSVNRVLETTVILTNYTCSNAYIDDPANDPLPPDRAVCEK